MEDAAGGCYLEMRGITKLYPGVTALNNVQFQANKGEIVALLGENGAGKSTLMNVLGGNTKINEGEIRIDGNAVVIDSVEDALKNQIGFIHQELSLFNELVVYENLFITDFKKRGIFLDKKAMVNATKSIMADLGMPQISPMTRVENLSMSQRQMVEIAGVVKSNAKIIILDEPTSSLSASECNKLFEIMQTLKRKGACIIFITHELDDALEQADRYYVLRNGTNAGDGFCKDIDKEGITQLMIGDKAGKKFMKKEREIKENVVLEIKDLNTGKVKNVSLQLHEGEILGLYGLVGAGRTEIIQAMYGLDKIHSGEISIFGKKVSNATPDSMMKNGVAYITENRREDGMFFTMPIRNNLTIAGMDKIKNKLRLLSTKKEKAFAKQLINDLQIATPSADVPVGKLSGGNQQKVVVGKWFHIQPRIFIMDEPTRGIDVGAKSEIYKLISDLTDSGASVLLISSEIEEILGISDRVGVMANGRIVAFLEGEKINRENIIRHTMDID